MLLTINANGQWVQTSLSIAANSNSLSERNLIFDSTAIKYFPLAIGNVYKYHFAAPGGYSYNYKVRIVKDTIINSKRYFITSRYFPGDISGPLRIDSASGNFYRSGLSGSCPYSPFEELIDSLSARKGDTTLVCTPYIPMHLCSDTGFAALFGTQVKKKSFSRITTESYTLITYGINFGIISSIYLDLRVFAGESLVGCYINGVLYGDTILTNVNKIQATEPSSFSLSQNYPNPFNPTTKIQFEVPGSKFVKIVVFDILGKEVQTLVNESLQPGTYETSFDGSSLTSGVYFYRLITNEFTETKKMLLIK